MRMSPETEESIRCTSSGCSCLCFKPGSVQFRSCDRCGHGWVPHALAKLHFQAQPPSGRGPVEVALPGLVFDLSSLVLYGAQAVPVRLKILLDRLYSVLTPEQVGHILHTLGWTLGDYVRGYMLQYPSGKVLDRWLTVTPEEELLILRQFLRFGETRPIVELMKPQYLAGVSQRSDPDQNPDLNPDLKGFNQSGPPGVYRNIRGDSVCCLKKTSPADIEMVPGGPSLLLPFHFPSSALHCLAPPTKELRPPGKLTQCLRKLSGAKMAESHRQEVGRREQEESELYLGFKIKADPDQHLDPDLQGTTTKQENSSLIPKSFQTSYSLNPLPSFSSSFLCTLPAPSFSSSLHPISSSSSSLCSFPPLSPAGGRKGRVCCGVCGKSFYDKGTLKIHYNAVHLKIKHRCTVVGCTMVFSSLRSRNRHSANPNPRLHTSSGRNTSLQSETQRDKSARRNRVTAHIDPQHGCRDDTPPHADSPPPSPCPLTRTLNQNQDCDRPDLQAPPPLLPARSAPSLGPPSSFVPLQLPEHFLNRHPLSLHSNHVVPTPLPDPVTVATNGNHDVTEGKQKEACVSPATNQRRRWQSGDPMPKKKPRKSSMPVKIERERNSGCNDTHS